MPKPPVPIDQVPRLPPSIGISEREMMGYGPSLWSRLKTAIARRRKK